METERPKVMSIAGLDPSGGAGLLADIKTFEQHKVIGYGCCTAITVQTASSFLSVSWLRTGEILAQAKPLLATGDIGYCKIGIMPGVEATLELVQELTRLQPGIRLILDPVVKSSTGFDFHGQSTFAAWKKLLRSVYLVTPNYEEAKLMAGCEDGELAALQLSAHCNVLLKGGHRTRLSGHDTLYAQGLEYTISPGVAAVTAKHGSGCILSAAITACLANGQQLTDACSNGKRYTEKVLASHSSLLGYHHL